MSQPDRLFTSLNLGSLSLSHRIVLAPMTRLRSSAAHVPLPMTTEYYAQRASTPGTLLITEATLISPRASGESHVPGIWSASQISAWKQVTNAIHAKGGHIFLQLWALGRRADESLLRAEEGGPWDVVSSSAVPIVEGELPVPIALDERGIRDFIGDYATAARNAMNAGFDGVEIHGANGYLPDQFLQETVNRRTDSWGGTVEHRSRFIVEVTKAVVEAVGDSRKVAVRLSPWSHFDGSIGVDGRAMNTDDETMDGPVAQFLHTVSALADLNLAYLHLVESRYAGSVMDASYHVLNQRNDPFINIWRDRTQNSAIVLAGGFTPENARKAVNEMYKDMNVCIAFGRWYISTPDLPFRVQRGLELNQYDRSTFYKKMSEQGYVDYPFCEEYLVSQKERRDLTEDEVSKS